MAEENTTLLGRIKDFAYKHAPEAVQMWVDDRASVKRYEAFYANMQQEDAVRSTAVHRMREWMDDRAAVHRIEASMREGEHQSHRAQLETAEQTRTWREGPGAFAVYGKMLAEAASIEAAIGPSYDNWKAAIEDPSRGPRGETVEVVARGPWVVASGGREATKTDIGKSDGGWHYRTEHSTDDHGSFWSKAFKTEDVAVHVAKVRGPDGAWLLSDRRLAGMQARQQSASQHPKGLAAEFLNRAAHLRDDNRLGEAKDLVGQARAVRERTERFDRDVIDIAAHSKRTPDLSRGVER